MSAVATYNPLVRTTNANNYDLNGNDNYGKISEIVKNHITSINGDVEPVGWLAEMVMSLVEFHPNRAQISLGKRLASSFKDISRLSYKVPKYVAGYGVSNEEAEEALTKTQVIGSDIPIFTRYHFPTLSAFVDKETQNFFETKKKNKILRLDNDYISKLSDRAIKEVPVQDAIVPIFVDLCLCKHGHTAIELKSTGDEDTSGARATLRERIITPFIVIPGNREVYIGIGGKTSDLKHLKSNFAEVFPKNIDRYFEPFLGGGAVWLAINSGCKMFVNDICPDLINFYHFIKSQDEKFLDFITKMGKAWTFLANVASEEHKVLYGGDVSVLEKHRDGFNSISLEETCYPTMVKILKSKTARINRLDEKNKCTATEDSSRDNVEGALKAGYYTYVRNVFNSYITSNEFDSPLRSACFYFLRDYSFSAMFRYNSDGHFNVPYGGMCYNGRSPAARIDYWRSEDLIKHLNNTTFDNMDFEEFLNKHKPTAKDFMFIDPPYDSDFSTYDKKEFGKKEQERLADYLINKTQSQFLAVMKNTDFIYNLYKGHEKNGIRYATFEKDYQVSIRNRNDRNVEHLVVYRITEEVV